MRNTGILIIIALAIGSLIGCKSSSVSSKSGPSEYNEDLSSLRPELEEIEEVIEPESFVENDVKVNYVDDLKEELDSVNQMIIAKNREIRYEDGFTIQIYTGNDRQAANEAKERVLLVDPDLDPVITYRQPSYKVKVGQYVDRLRAHEVYQSLKEEFPLALLIPERIQVDYD